MRQEMIREDGAADTLVQLNEERAATYGLLARVYRVELDDSTLVMMHGMRFPVESGNEKVNKGVRLLVDALSNLWENSSTDFAVDYARVFLGNGIDSYAAAYPFESVYTSPKRLLMQEARDEVLAIYRSEGLDKKDGWTEGEDHIALELEFMQVMIARSNELLKSGDDEGAARLFKVQSNFLDAHLANWIPMMTADIRRFSRTDLYRGVSWYTEGFLEMERDFLDSMMKENEDYFA